MGMGYFELREKSIDCCNRAIEYWKKNEFDLAKFWVNASKEFKERALNLLVDKEVLNGKFI